jgi:uncharacterized protein
MANLKPLLTYLEQHCFIYSSDFHGLSHWRTVECNGLYLCQFNNADPKVVSYFAYTHDCCRENEFEDPEHGPRAAKFIKEHRDFFDLDDDQLKLLGRACSGHTHGRNCEDETIMTCWDADRLDIGRVGIQPDSRYLFTEEAKRIADECDFDVLRNHLEK